MNSLNLLDDHLAWDGVEEVSLISATRGGGRVISLERAKRRNVRSRERSPSGGVYIGAEVNWHLPGRDIPEGMEPKPGDHIEDSDGRYWTVLTVSANRQGYTWSLGCVDLLLAHDLRDRIMIESPEVYYDHAGVGLKRWVLRYNDVPAKVHAIDQHVAEERGVRASAQRYEIVVGSQLSVDIAEDRIVWGNNPSSNGHTTYLDITGYRNPGRIDELPVIEAELRR